MKTTVWTTDTSGEEVEVEIDLNDVFDRLSTRQQKEFMRDYEDLFLEQFDARCRIPEGVIQDIRSAFMRKDRKEALIILDRALPWELRGHLPEGE